MMDNLEKLTQDPGTVGEVLSYADKHYTIAIADNFEYTDPIDKSVSKKQARFWCLCQCNRTPS